MGEPDPVPRMVGRYALYEKIASGGMASVHLGRLLGPVGFARTVAIKRMHPQFSEDPEFVSMFLDEARLAARIRHPHVVPTLDVVARDGELFLVMEFVQGESFARLIRAATMKDEHVPPPMVATIMAGVLHGLHAAHEATNERGEPLDIVHRDVSPHNVIVGTDGVARVLDFGVAKAVGRLQSTRDGQLKGKIGYMAPEQVRGTVTRRTDVYSASVVLWEALTGKRLFAGDNELHTLEQVMRGCSEPPSNHNPGVPLAVDELTMRGLSVDPEKRFPTAREMARALEAAIPPVTASAIGDWVEAVARDTLHERSVRIASIESDSSTRVPESLRHPPAAAVVNVPRPPATDPMPITEDGTQMQLSSALVPPPVRVAGAGGRSRASKLAAAAGGGVLLTMLVAAAAWRPRAVSVATTPAVAAAPALEPVASASAAPLPVAVSEVASTAPASSALPAPTTVRAAPSPRPSPAAASRAPAKKSNPLDLQIQ